LYHSCKNGGGTGMKFFGGRAGAGGEWDTANRISSYTFTYYIKYC